MGQTLAGLGTFTRPSTPQVPHPTAVALDLGLRASAPQADRPWACRVSVRLMRPGPDGLAKDVADVERTGSLGPAMLARLGRDAVWAAVVTVAGTRTWLIYARSTDAAAATATVRAAARLAFAEQADYVPAVAVESDPGWAGYLALYPTDAEAHDIRRQRAEVDAVARARVATHAALNRLRAAGVDPAPAVPIDYQLTFPTDVARTLFLHRAVAFGRVTDRAAASPADGFPVQLTRDGRAEPAAIGRAEQFLIREAIKSGGRYDGWSLPTAMVSAAA